MYLYISLATYTCMYLFLAVQHDPIHELLLTHFPNVPRKTLPSVESVSMDMAGLRKLVVSPYTVS